MAGKAYNDPEVWRQFVSWRPDNWISPLEEEPQLESLAEIESPHELCSNPECRHPRHMHPDNGACIDPECECRCFRD